MASSVSSISRQEVSTLMRQIQSNQLYNRQLSSICQINGLKSTGVKIELQNRIVGLIQEAVNANDAARFCQVRQSIINAIAQRGSPAKMPARHTNSTPSHSSLATQYSPTASSYSPGTISYQQQGYNVAASTTPNRHLPMPQYPTSTMSSTLTFRPSPFYRIEDHVSTLRVCEVMTAHRHSISIPLELNECPALQRCLGDRSYRVMIFCSSEATGVQNITFPYQSELKVNGSDIKANMRGLKNKPGSTRPVDITNALRLRPGHVNNIEFTYALTNKVGHSISSSVLLESLPLTGKRAVQKFYLIANLCKVTTVSELESIVSNRLTIPKETVVAELNKIAQDPDVVATSQILSLKCPLSYMRLEIPCRSLSCIHIQCFDATSYLQLQEQGPQWTCPICNKPAPFDQLAVDNYVKDILDNTPKDLESVTIEPNGRWRVHSSQDDQTNALEGSAFGDDDLVEISETIAHGGGRKMETPRNATPNIRTPVSNGSTSMPRGAATFSAKRPASAVIDLTEDSDEESVRAPHKRQNTGANGGCNGFAGSYLGESPVGYSS
ncbi:hypothetical protein CDD80_3133 [Ophiocordyceps camponoti-rufipedis]|uniref:SP-RING-type domain-containing protein n=1 Tax=Ophiocordyceps camponoti-rufipedis TaxID=2004952 RepID=A0A2C5ZKR9_9HYPO|nr:hypothetical protein CDD80_3133 [Ophiocordyceps camponoti-rufipedis]